MRVKMILNNLISNALKYQDPLKKEHLINISMNENGSWLNILCEDNGIGIENNYLERVFYMFYRATELSKGSGLGLYIANETAKKLGGEISVKSKVKHGTVFTVSLPKIR